MPETFSWKVLSGVNLAETPNVRASAMGDGYEQRVGLGINVIREKWSIRVMETSTFAVRAFLVARAGVESFNWTAPTNSSAKLYLCRSWTLRHMGGTAYEISAEFEEVFGE